MSETLDAIAAFTGDLHSAGQLTLLLIGILLTGVFFVWNLSPARALVAWLITFSS